jgi:hypothetical protein
MSDELLLPGTCDTVLHKKIQTLVWAALGTGVATVATGHMLAFNGDTRRWELPEATTMKGMLG